MKNGKMIAYHSLPARTHYIMFCVGATQRTQSTRKAPQRITDVRVSIFFMCNEKSNICLFKSNRNKKSRCFVAPASKLFRNKQMKKIILFLSVDLSDIALATSEAWAKSEINYSWLSNFIFSFRFWSLWHLHFFACRTYCCFGLSAD